MQISSELETYCRQRFELHRKLNEKINRMCWLSRETNRKPLCVISCLLYLKNCLCLNCKNSLCDWPCAPTIVRSRRFLLCVLVARNPGGHTVCPIIVNVCTGVNLGLAKWAPASAQSYSWAPRTGVRMLLPPPNIYSGFHYLRSVDSSLLLDYLFIKVSEGQNLLVMWYFASNVTSCAHADSACSGPLSTTALCVK